MSSRWAWFHRLASPPHFYALAGRLIPWFGRITLLLMAVGLFLGLFVAPADYQQGDSVRIMYVHVPSAWMSMFVYLIMASAAAIGLIWRIKLSYAVAASCAPLGASFTFLALATGSLWGKPTWGTWWVWDARLTSELLLLFLYIGYMALRSSFNDRNQADRASAVLAIVGVVNLPIIHYSVIWWNTLHQAPSVSKFGKPDIVFEMLLPLLIMAVAFMTYFATVLLIRVRSEILVRSHNTSWVQKQT